MSTCLFKCHKNDYLYHILHLALLLIAEYLLIHFELFKLKFLQLIGKLYNKMYNYNNKNASFMHDCSIKICKKHKKLTRNKQGMHISKKEKAFKENNLEETNDKLLSDANW